MCIAHSFRAFAHNDLKMEKIAFVDANNNFEAIKILYQNCTFLTLFRTLCIHSCHSLSRSFHLCYTQKNAIATLLSRVVIFFVEYYYLKSF